MWLPTQAQVNAATRNIASAVGGAVLMFGLSTKIDIDSVNRIIAATGTVVNDVIVIVGLVSPMIAAYFASKSASPSSQAASVASVPGSTVITTPEIAAAVPALNVVSNTDVKPVNK